MIIVPEIATLSNGQTPSTRRTGYTHLSPRAGRGRIA
jgi:hypothetical protein